MIKQLDASVFLYFASIGLLILITHLPKWVTRKRDTKRNRTRTEIEDWPRYRDGD